MFGVEITIRLFRLFGGRGAAVLASGRVSSVIGGVADVLASALSAILPGGVAAHATAYRSAGGGSGGGGTGSARQAEFAAGRVCARAALTAVGAPGAPPGRDSDGLPLWPAGFLGSISHSKGLACAVAANSADFRALGLDVERTNRLSAGAMRRILHDSEQERVGGDTVRGTLVFSLKEAAFKAVFAAQRAGPGFADLAFEWDEATGEAELVRISKSVSPPVAGLLADMGFRFRFFRPRGVVAVVFSPGGGETAARNPAEAMARGRPPG